MVMTGFGTYPKHKTQTVPQRDAQENLKICMFEISVSQYFYLYCKMEFTKDILDLEINANRRNVWYQPNKGGKHTHRQRRHTNFFLGNDYNHDNNLSHTWYFMACYYKQKSLVKSRTKSRNQSRFDKFIEGHVPQDTRP